MHRDKFIIPVLFTFYILQKPSFMKNILKMMSVMFLLFSAGKAFAQPNIDLVLTGGPNMGVYAGYPLPATYNITLSNGSGQSITANHFMIVLSVPNGFQFDAYPGVPNGWSYVIQSGGLSVNLIPTANVAGFPPAGIVSFSVPMHTTAAVANQPFLGQIQILVPSFQDNDNTNNTPQGTVTVLNTTPLGVDIKSFSAVAEGCKANISWTTGEETNNKYFTVERSRDGITFSGIGKVNAKGEGGNGAAYSFVDADPVSGKNFYRVRQVNTDGRSTVSNTLALSFNCGTTRIELFPNPTSAIVNVKGLSGKNTVKIMTVTGQDIMKTETEQETCSMLVNALASGTYHVQVIKNNEIVFNGKFVKAD